MPATEREASLYRELLSFPQLFQELLAIQDDTVGVLLSSPMLSHQNCISRSKKSSGGSRVERLVVRVLASEYVCNLEYIVAACRALYDDSDPFDQRLLLSCWGDKESMVTPFPSYLLYRYQYFKEQIAERLHDQTTTSYPR